MKLTPAVLALLVGCTDVPEEAPLTAYAGGYGGYDTADCPHSDCGMNTGHVNGVFFSNLNFTKKKNESGVVLESYGWLPNGATRLAVAADDHRRLVAKNGAGTVVAQHTALEGSVMKLRVEGELFDVVLTDVHLTTGIMWWAASEADWSETYTFKWKPSAVSGAPLTPLCKTEKTVDGMLQLDAVVFDGEIYESDTKQRVVPPASEQWFNIACFGSGVAKTFMMQHVFWNQPSGSWPSTSPDDWQALMNAWTANYCGDGVGWTKTGEPLRMRDNKKWILPTSKWNWQYDIGMQPAGTLPSLSSYEAIWNEDGAVCLNVPRREDNEPGLREKIIEHCASVGKTLKPCSDGGLPVGWENQGHLLTANPFVLIAIPAVLIAP